MRYGRVWLLGSGLSASSIVEVKVKISSATARTDRSIEFPDGPTFTWLGTVDDDAVVAELVSADLLVAPSLGGESFGIVLLEAMAAGVPVVASDLPAYRLVAGEAAFLVPPSDPHALARAIDVLLGDPAMRRKLVDAGRDRVRNFTFASPADSYRVHYEDLVALRRSATHPTRAEDER